jgi:hypothetical protein
MNTKKLLALSLAVNAVLLSAVAYIRTLPTEPKALPPFIRYVTNSAPPVVEQTADPDPAPGDEHIEPPKNP